MNHWYSLNSNLNLLPCQYLVRKACGSSGLQCNSLQRSYAYEIHSPAVFVNAPCTSQPLVTIDELLVL